MASNFGQSGDGASIFGRLGGSSGLDRTGSSSTSSLFGGGPSSRASLFGSTKEGEDTPAFDTASSSRSSASPFGPSSTQTSTKTPIFGASSTSQLSSTPLFGASSASQPSSAAPVFGLSSAAQPSSTRSPFDVKSTSTVPTFGVSSPAGSSATPGPLSATPKASDPPSVKTQESTPLFGSSTAATSFSAATGTSLFGKASASGKAQNASSQPPSSTAPSQFGATPGKPDSSLFGGTDTKISPAAPRASNTEPRALNFGGGASTPGGGLMIAGADKSAVAASTVSGDKGPGIAPNIPSEIMSLNLDEVLNKWSSDVEQLSAQFQKAAALVARWDASVVANENRIASLHREAQAITVAHNELATNLDVILAQQSQLHQVLDGLEKQLESKYGPGVLREQEKEDVVNTALDEREEMGRVAEKVLSELDGMGGTIRELVTELNSGGGSTGDRLKMVVSVLNAHLDSLTYLDDTSVTLQRKVQDIGRIVDDMQRETRSVRPRRQGALLP